MTNSTAPLVLVAPPDASPADLERAVDNLTTITGGRVPVVVVPHGWTQAQIDETAIRAAVAAEREGVAGLLRAIEWNGADRYDDVACPACGASPYPKDGTPKHKGGCRLAALIGAPCVTPPPIADVAPTPERA